MSRIAVRAEGLGKRYRIGTAAARHDSLRAALAHAAGAPFRNLANLRRMSRFGREAAESESVVWALRDVSFEIPEGKAVGIVGRNGAGKSTLLKLLSRITDPTTGRVEIHGRVGSLLEVGTGFHPELTGRENIYLNGSILGMDRAYIDRKFGEIVEFSGVERYVDTPVKRYSSGMYLRLAFAVAAHLEPEVLIVDEVLAVGDMEFQKKCMGKMGEVAKEGRTVLFVSHNMGAVTRLCQQAIWMEGGRVRMVDEVESVVAAYLGSGVEAAGERCWPAAQAPGNDKMRLSAVRLVEAGGRTSATLDVRRPFGIEIEYRVLVPLPHVRVALRLLTDDGTVVFTSADSGDPAWRGETREPGVYVSRCEIPGDFLNEGLYSVMVSADVPFVEILFQEENAVAFNVEQTGGVGGDYPERWPGVICPALPWSVQVLEAHAV